MWAAGKDRVGWGRYPDTCEAKQVWGLAASEQDSSLRMPSGKNVLGGGDPGRADRRTRFLPAALQAKGALDSLEGLQLKEE